ncbi:hypothetical protein [uncultured Algoriphagus sp.]|uniref:hypothetical protein n=1 Tax=uncultured Algoriphagus sp. TaxID=417365 RepID=UPI0030EF5580|tara:strand:+ start:4731 stop:5645 length:915 start_codon:yes stop_codon:yes gene_type:complete
MNVGRFEFIENVQARFVSTIPTILEIDGPAREELILVRLLTGTLKIKDQITGSQFVQKNNYSKTDYSENRVISMRPVRDCLDVGLSEVHLSQYITNSIHYGNKKLFKNFLLELSHFFLCKENNSHLSGFLHLYRSLEFISYCFPLFYASRSKDYHGTFNTLKGYFKGSDGERDFLKKFVNEHLFKTDPILDIQLHIPINAVNPILQKQFYDAFLKIQSQNRKQIELINSLPNYEIITNRKSLISIMISLRNRNFHLLEGDYNDNLTSEELYDFDGFYSNFNEIFLNWIALIYFKLLNKAVEFDK